jgi:hypothetical protein
VEFSSGVTLSETAVQPRLPDRGVTSEGEDFAHLGHEEIISGLKLQRPFGQSRGRTGARRPATASLIAEARRTLTINGKPIPPEIFRDFGDGDMADSGPSG